MTRTRDELREHLLAALEAAPELPREDRGHLADAFLDSLDRDFELVPRSVAARTRTAVGPRGARIPVYGFRPWWPAPAIVGLMLLFFAMVSVFAFHHAPVFLFVILFIVAARFFVPWRGQRKYFS